MIEALSGQPFRTVAEGGATGLVGTIGVAIKNVDGTVNVARSTAGIVEVSPGTYVKQLTAPVAVGDYVVTWDTGGGSPVYASEILRVYLSTAPPDVFDLKLWYDGESGDTAVDADAMNDLEGRIKTGVGVGDADVLDAASAYADAIAAGGIELGYAEITADASVSSTTPADVAGLSTTVTTASRPVVVIFDANAVLNTGGGGGTRVDLLEDGAIIGRSSSLDADANASFPVHRERRRAPSAGSHTYKIRLATVLSGTATIKADNGTALGPAFITVREV